MDMEVTLQAFEAIALYLKHPLVLIGFVLLLFFGLLRALLKAGILPQLTIRTGGKVIQILLRYGFVIALFIIALGFALEFYKTYRLTQPPIDVTAIIEQIEARHRHELERIRVQHQVELTDWKKQAAEAVTALANLRGHPDAPVGLDKALTFLEQGRTEDAEAVFQAIAEQKSADIQEAAEAYRNLGALAFFRDTEKALMSYRRATELDPDNAEGWSRLGSLLLRIGKLNEAEAAVEKIKALGERKNDQALLAIAYNQLGIIYSTRGKQKEAESVFKKSLALNEFLGYKEDIASNYSHLANVYYISGEIDRAGVYYKKALAINKALNRKEGIANVYSNLGNVCLKRMEPFMAEAMYKKSLSLNVELNDKVGMANNYSNLGNIYYIRGNLNKSDEMYQKSLLIDEAMDYKEGMAKSYINLGLNNEARGKLDEAEDLYKKALVIFKDIGVKSHIEEAEQLLQNLHNHNEPVG
jgi:tetratricopeptide (TPR) repeat protein